MRKILPYLMLLMLVAAPTHAATAYRYSDSVTTVRGDAVGGASVYVYLANTTTKVALYTGPSTALQQATNPTTTDGYGRFTFFVEPGLYDLYIHGNNFTAYTLQDVRVFSDTEYIFNVVDYGANGADSVNDSTAIKAAVAAAAGALMGGRVYFPPGVYIAQNIGVRGNDICIDMSDGALIASSSTTLPVFRVNASTRFTMVGGILTGPGKASATVNCVGVSVDSLSGATFDGVDISGFYHGIRATDYVTGCRYEGLFIHSIRHTGLWPRAGDIVSACRFYDIGTLSTHHGMYFDTVTKTGASLVGNHYRAISGAAVHIFDETGGFYGITATGETMVKCGYGYLIDSTDARNITIAGAAIDSCVHVATHDTTGFGIKINGTARNLNIQASISATDSTALDCNGTALSDSYFDITATGSSFRGVTMAGDDCSGTFTINDPASIGFYLNGGLRNNFIIRSRGSAAEGIYVTGNSKRNLLDIYASKNISHGIGLAAGSDSNVVRGVSGANNGSELNDSGTGNVTTGLVQW